MALRSRSIETCRLHAATTWNANRFNGMPWEPMGIA
jgi:hypothetical protein